MHDLTFLRDLVILFAASVVVVLAVARIGLPSIAGMILAGALVGPHALRLISERERVQAIGEVGVVLLLFGVGLELPFERLRLLWKATLIGGGLQVLATGVAAYAIARACGGPPATALMAAFVTVPSSTAIVLRSLDAKGEIDAPHGKIMLGILLFQDLCVLPMMLVLGAMGGHAEAPDEPMLPQLARSTLLLVALAGGARLLVPRMLEVAAAARQRDVFVLSVFVVSIGTAWAASMAGVSLAIGAFLAGVVVAGSEYRHQVAGELIPFREVFASLFFVSAGMLLDLRQLFPTLHEVLGLLLLLFTGKALVVLAIAAVMRIPVRAAVISAVGLAHAGEFSLVMLRAAHGRSWLPARVENELLTVTILSMLATPLLLALAPRVSAHAERSRFAQLFPGSPQDAARSPKCGHREHVILAGYGVAGRALAARLSAERIEVVVVDLNDKLVRAAAQDGFTSLFGDVASPEILERVGVHHARQVVLLINDPSALERAVVSIRRSAPHVTILVRTRYQGDVPRLSALGADAVIAAEVEAGRAVIEEVVARHSSLPPPAR